MTILSKACKPDNFESHLSLNSLKLSFTNIRGLRSNFVDCESFLESNSPDILALYETDLDDSIDSSNFLYFELFWMEILHKNIQLMREFLAVHFSYYTLKAFLTMLSVILLSLLMILLSILSVIRDLICGNNLNWLPSLNLIYGTLWTGVRSGLLISVLGKFRWSRLTGPRRLVNGWVCS